MMKSLLSSYSSLVLAIYRLAQELPVNEFQDAVLHATKPLLPFDTSMWGTATMRDAGIDIHSLHLHNTTSEMIEAYERIKHLDVAAAQVASVPVATLAFSTADDFPGERFTAYREYLHRFKHENSLITCEINPVTRFGQWISLWRGDPAHRCTPEDVELLASLAPHLMQALAINRLVHADRLVGDAARENWSVAIADTRAVIYHADPRFRELVRRDWPDDDPSRLPQALMDQLLAQDGEASGRHAVVRRSRERALLFLKARARAEVDDLTQREFLVASLLASGLSHKEVASRLGRSPETIRSQAKSIFLKLGINSVVRLAPMVALRS